jgi:ribosomal protein S12 methylthiotransferase
MKINLTTLGCPKNLVDSEILLGGLAGPDIQIVEDPNEAETIILNTCGFIQGAKEESLDAIMAAIELKKSGNCRNLFVTGCLSERYRQQLLKEIPEVDGFYGNRDMIGILQALTGKLDLQREILGERKLLTPNHYAYLKISEGCENPCTFCAIPGIRGKFRSRSTEALTEEAHRLADDGVKELIIVAQDTTMYGIDLYGEPRLVALLESLTQMCTFKWIRLLYTFPAHFSDDLLQLLLERQEIIKYVDMPVQHISDRLLKLMARKIDRYGIEMIIDKLRSESDIALRTSVISGFPGETEQEYSELKEFIQTTRFERLGLFAYSREDDTPAYDFENQVPEFIQQERMAELADIQNQVSEELNQSWLNSVKEIVVDEFDNERGSYMGRTACDCPEIDNTVLLELHQKVEVGSFYKAKITACSEYELQAQLCSKIPEHMIELAR